MARSRPITVTISGSKWPDEIANGVFVQWCIQLAAAQLGLNQWSGPNKLNGSMNFSNPAERRSFVITPAVRLSWKVTEIVGIDPGDLNSLVALAAEKTGIGDSGPELVYQVMMECRNPPLSGDITLSMFRVMGGQVPTTRSRRLADVALLDFTQDMPQSGQVLFVPDTKITATIFVPGPVQGPIATYAAHGLFETVSAICAFALGRPVSFPELAHVPVSADVAEAQRARRHDVRILGLARDYVSLDIFGELMALGGFDAGIRARNSFITIHEAQRQANADIATMLYVCAIEALVTPGRQCKWRKEQVTKRFRNAVLSLCEAEVDRLLAHQSLEDALGFRKRGNVERQRREVVDHIYELRSLPTHTGIGLQSSSIMTFADDRSITVALLSDLARAALLAYMQAPRSFLTGHPAFQSQ